MPLSLIIAGALLHLVLTALLVFGVLHYLEKKVNAVTILENLKTLLADLEALDFAAFIKKVQDDATSAETAIEGEVEAIYTRLESVVANVKAVMNPAPAEPPAA